MTENFYQNPLCADVAFHKNGQILTILLWFLAFLNNFWPQIAQKCQKPEVVDFSTTRCGFSQKWPNLDYFTREFGKTTSGSSPKQDILEVWQKHVCLCGIKCCVDLSNENLFEILSCALLRQS